MTHLAPTASQIRSRVQSVLKKYPAARFVGIRSPVPYTGERLVHYPAGTLRIEQCDCPLAIRVVLATDEPGVTVIVTPLEDVTALGEDVGVRLAGRTLYGLDPWQLVREVYQVQSIDPRLRCHEWLPPVLLDRVNLTAPLASDYLDAETVWPELLERLIGLSEPILDLSLVLHWSTTPENASRYVRLPEPQRIAVETWLGETLGAAVSAVLRCIRASGTADPVPVGLALEVIHHPSVERSLDRAAGRLERLVGGPTPEETILKAWSGAAVEVSWRAEEDVRSRVFHRAEEILREVQADSHAHLSSVLPAGFCQRLARFGGQLTRVLTASSPESELSEVYHAIAGHREATRDPRSVERVEMALRLTRWIDATTDRPSPRSLSEATDTYSADGSFVDWARTVLRASEPVRALAEGYANLLSAVEARREAQNRWFAEFLRDQLATGTRPTGLIPVERVLEEVVAPLAGECPVLLILLDGMSAAVSRSLLSEVACSGWVPIGPAGRPLSPGLATVPSVTEASRTSLFCGRLATGGQADEAKGFAAHPALRRHCRANAPPVLFHKVDLQAAADPGLAPKVRDAIASPQKRVVGVVVNAVDDYLSKCEQLDLRWTPDEIKVLKSLLFEARSADRVVILVSDHGHLLDAETRCVAEGEGERWRQDTGPVAEGEIAVIGPRVLIAEGHRLIAPWSERLRYSKTRKNGYHGGLTPQEMVIPISVLFRPGHGSIAGWTELPDPAPDWWDPPPSAGSAPSISERPTATIRTPRGRSLFEHIPDEAATEPTAASARWVASVLASPLFTARRSSLGSEVEGGDSTVARILEALDRATVPVAAASLARHLRIPLNRFRETLGTVQRLLNVDGFAVFSWDEPSDLVALDRALLLGQFDLRLGG